MKKLIFHTAVFLIFLSISIVSCGGGRVPSPRTAQKIVQKHFVKYGKQYKESDFGKHFLQKVEIQNVVETQKDMAGIEAFATLTDGPVYWVNVMVVKKPSGWKYLSWETLGVR